MAHCESLGLCYHQCSTVLIAAHSWDTIPWEFPGCWNVLLAGIDYWRTIMIVFGKLFLEETTELNSGQQFCSQFTESTFSCSLKFFVVKITWGIARFPTAVFLAVNLVQHALHKGLSTQRVWHCACANACMAVQRLSRKYVHKISHYIH